MKQQRRVFWLKRVVTSIQISSSFYLLMESRTG